MNQAFASDAQAQQRSLNRSLWLTVDSPLVHLGGHFLNDSMPIRPKASPQPSFISVFYGPWCTIFVTLLILDSPILPCTVCFYKGSTRTFYKLSRFGNAFTLGSKVNDHALLNVASRRRINRSISALRQRLQCFLKSSHTFCTSSTALCCYLPSVNGYLISKSKVNCGHINVTRQCIKVPYVKGNAMYSIQKTIMPSL